MTQDDQRIDSLSPADVSRDVDLILWAFKLLRIRRYVHQPYWRTETLDAEYADRLESFPRMETVAEHSWTVADTVILLAPNFPYLHRSHATELAILHDKMEIVIGDMNPLGADGTGSQGHAFNPDKQLQKYQREVAAIEWYVRQLRPRVAQTHKALLMESLKLLTPEARFVRAVDKMQALAFILLKKGGRVEEKHLSFLIKYTDQNDRYFPPLKQHSQELLWRIFRAAAKHRSMQPEELWRQQAAASTTTDGTEQLILFPDDKPLSNGGHALHGAGQSTPEHAGQPTSPGGRFGRLLLTLAEVGRRPPARTGLEAYRQISDALNRIEDLHLGDEHWAPPRHLGPGTRTERLYPIAPENIYPVPDFPGVDLLASVAESVFISRTGAIQVQRKRPQDLLGATEAFHRRKDDVIFEKADASGCLVWDDMNRT